MSSSASESIIDRVSKEDVQFAIKWCVRIQIFVVGYILGMATVAIL